MHEWSPIRYNILFPFPGHRIDRHVIVVFHFHINIKSDTLEYNNVILSIKDMKLFALFDNTNKHKTF